MHLSENKTHSDPGWGVWVVLVAGMILITGALILHRFHPAEHRFYPRCRFHQATGLHCPGCGSQRAMHELLHGRWRQALHSNALLVMGAPLVIGWLVGMAWRRHKGLPPSLPVKRRVRMLFWGLIVCTAFTILRNIPAKPFSYLAP